jgi:hypothetical protein
VREYPYPEFRDHGERSELGLITELWARQLADVQLAGWSASARATIPAPLPKRQHDLGGHDAGPAGHVREGEPEHQLSCQHVGVVAAHISRSVRVGAVADRTV